MSTPESDKEVESRELALNEIVEQIKKQFTEEGKAIPSQLALKVLARKRYDALLPPQ